METSSLLEKTLRWPTARMLVRIPLRLKKGVTSSLASVDGSDQRIPFVCFWECLRAWLTETVSLRGHQYSTVSVTAPIFTNYHHTYHHHHHLKPIQRCRVSDLELPEVLK